ncbi:PAS domain S-box protein [Flexistipes sp.]|uniref:PAS domain S-box protein n=1 Tax=Flexistipes sp. TaxID=3088135 RepID=UPI002E22532E|nr:PAS domain S-box protein [Flexistipes sp.]
MNNSQKLSYQNLLDSIPVPIFYKGTDGKYLGMNKAFEDFFGASRENLIGKGVYDITDKEYADVYFKKDKELFGNPGVQIYETQVKNNQGNIHEVVFNKATFFDETGKVAGLVGTILDVTEKVNSEKEISEKQRKLETLMSNLPGMVYQCLNDPDWTMLFVSNGCVDLTGYSAEKLINNNYVSYGSIIHHDDQTKIWEKVQESIKRNNNFVSTYRILTKEGDIRWVWEQGVKVGKNENGIDVLEGYITDITEAKKYYDELQTTKAFVDDAPDAIYWTRENGAFAFVNKTAAQMLGYHVDELSQMSIFDIDKELNDEAFEKIWNNVDIRNSITIERKHQKKDGSFIPVEISVRKINFAGEDLHGSFVRDLTERKKAEKEKEILNAKLNQSSKLEAIGRMAGGIAHDFNNMLSVILSYSEMGLLKSNRTDQFHEYFEEIGKAAHKSAEITDQLLNFAREKPISPKILNLNESVKDMKKMLSKVVGKNIELNCELSSNLWPVKIDPSQISQILTNLCVNARDAIKNKGTVEIKTSNEYLDEEFCISESECYLGEYVALSVKDNGMGMSKETQKKIFEPFFTTKKEGNGTGIGLATLYGIAKQNGGFINVQSKLGVGTTFEVYLPRYKGEKTVSDEETTSILKGNGETILLIDDDTSILAISNKVLKKLNYKVVPRLSASEAIQTAIEYKENNKDIDLLITDVVMPEMNGKELFHQMQKVYPEIKTLFISGYSESNIQEEKNKSSNIFFLQKPFDIKSIGNKLKEIL